MQHAARGRDAKIAAALSKVTTVVNAEEEAALEAQLAALEAGPASRWRRFRRLEWVCGGCGDVLLEVMGTQPPVILVRQRLEPDLQPPVYGPAGPAKQKHTQRVKVYWLLDDPSDPRNDDQIIESVCRCQQLLTDRPQVQRYLDDRVAKVTAPVGAHKTPEGQRPVSPLTLTGPSFTEAIASVLYTETQDEPPDIQRVEDTPGTA